MTVSPTLRWTRVFLLIVFLLSVTGTAGFYSSLAGASGAAEDYEMSKVTTEVGNSCELPGTLENSDDGSSPAEQTVSAVHIPPMDLKAPEGVLTATFALG